MNIARLEDRAALARRALFFIPSAWVRVYEEAGLNVAALTRRAGILRSQQHDGDIAGREALEKVLACDQPVAYARAKGFITVANAELTARNEHEGRAFRLFQEADIVACVFRLRDAPEIMDTLALTPERLSEETGIPLDIVKAAVRKERYRISLDHALRIWRRLLAITSRLESASDKLIAITRNPADLICTDERYNMSIRKVAGRRSEDDERYVYSRDHLVAAPEEGHPWALSPKTAVA
ncbi:hypothetical protein [uncultured Brevundimonas sp.]|uniref:hypothetical protein n=1 Tax=uncultured Brevundimonas sp. TaxID=213418 RepID=UPI002639091C|nr:hypothetical protein [uncultured Brevundimonas sp.]